MTDVYTFGGLELDERLYQLRRGSAVVKLEPKVFDVLVYLVRHRERVVAKDELLAKLWPGEHVSESVLPRCITAARKAVGDSATAQRVIATVHGRGYRFVAPIDVAAGDERGEDGAPAHATAAGAGAAAATSPRDVFVGREDAMAELRAALREALHGRGRLVLLVGEPGIGKTRTADEIAAEARRFGASVLTGRCYEGDGAPAFWPWVQVLRAASESSHADWSLARTGGGAADLAQLVPELAERARRPSRSATTGGAAAPHAPTPSSVGDVEQARFRLFDSTSVFLRSLAATQPLVIVVDDLHWADKPSLLLLQFLAREIADVPVLVVATYRDVELRRQHPLAAALGELGREPVCTRIMLRGLGAGDVARFIAAITGAAATPEAVAAIVSMTDGNPFFLGEIVRLLAAEGLLVTRGRLDVSRPGDGDPATWSTALPQGVREAIGRRLSALSEECNRVLALASVLGREFRVTELRALAERDADDVLEVLNEAADARIVVPSGDLGKANAPTRWAFAHALVRETLYEELTVPVRVRLHRRAGEVLEQAHAAEMGPHVAELAHHFYQASAGGAAEKAITYALAAGRRASASLAYEEAAGHFERALEALEFTATDDGVRRCELLLGLGTARTRASEREAARGTFRRAAEVARTLGRPDLLAHAALGFGGRAEFGVGPDPEMRTLLDEALAALPAEHIALRSRVLSRMVGTVPYCDSMATRATLSEEAVALARRAGDPVTLADALGARHWALLGPDHVEERRALGDELLALADATGDKTCAFNGRDCRFTALLGLGDIAAADRELDELRALAAELRQPIEQWFVAWFHASRAIADGRFAEGERHIREALAIGERAQHPAAIPSFRGQMLWLRGEQGGREDIAEVEDTLRFLLPLYAGRRPILQSAIVNLYVDVDRCDDARREFEALVAHDLRDVERDENWMVTMAMGAEAAADLHDARRGALVYDLLEPFAERNVVHDLIRAYRGSVSLYLALAATAMAAWEPAARHYEDALAMNGRMGVRPYVARAEYEYARMLLQRGRRADRSRARQLLASALATARALGMCRLEEKVTPLVAAR